MVASSARRPGVPLDYQHPGGAQISIAVVRHLATDPARRLGSLFMQKFRSALPLFPVGAKQDAQWEQTWARFDAQCGKTNGALDHPGGKPALRAAGGHR
jgi:hypothetical protein